MPPGMYPDGLLGIWRRSSVGQPTHCQERAKRHTTNYKLMKFREKALAAISTNQFLKINQAINEQQGINTVQSDDIKRLIPKTVHLVA